MVYFTLLRGVRVLFMPETITKTANEKLAWTELIVSLTTLVIVCLLVPFLGDRASGAFGLLAFLVAGMWFVRKQGNKIVKDERDREIEVRANLLGIGSAWMLLLLALIGLVLWSSSSNDSQVPTSYLNWLVWIQFALWAAVRGLVGILSYRAQRHDS